MGPGGFSDPARQMLGYQGSSHRFLDNKCISGRSITIKQEEEQFKGAALEIVLPDWTDWNVHNRQDDLVMNDGTMPVAKVAFAR